MIVLAKGLGHFYNGYMVRNKMFLFKHPQSGQVLLITLLVLSLATTLVLSAIGRTTTDVGITNQVADSSRAFNAAEAGIEDALKTGIAAGSPTTLSPGVTYTVTQTNVGGSSGVFQFPKKTARGNSETVWLVNHAAGGGLVEVPTYTSPSIDVCWSSEISTPAMNIAVFYKTSAGLYRVARSANDPVPARASINQFSGVTALSGGCGATSATTYRQTVRFTSFVPGINPVFDTLLFLRLQPVYSDARIAVTASGVLPVQGARFVSSGNTDSGTTRKIIVYQQYRTPPSIFDNVIYSLSTFGH